MKGDHYEKRLYHQGKSWLRLLVVQAMQPRTYLPRLDVHRQIPCQLRYEDHFQDDPHCPWLCLTTKA